MIELQHLSKNFGSLMAVQDLNFNCAPGEIFALLGENGAGKTRTLRLLATILQPTSGTAKLNGYDLQTEAHLVRHQIGVLTTEPGLYDRLTVRETLRYFGQLYDMSLALIEERSQELIDLLGMAAYADRRTSQLSRGMKQKVAIARALLHDPPIVLLDEPTSGLDVVSARTVLDFVLQLRKRGKCIVFSSHVMSEVERICDRVAIIHQGRLVACGTLDEVKQAGSGELEEIFVRLAGVKA